MMTGNASNLKAPTGHFLPNPLFRESSGRHKAIDDEGNHLNSAELQ